SQGGFGGTRRGCECGGISRSVIALGGGAEPDESPVDSVAGSGAQRFRGRERGGMGDVWNRHSIFVNDTDGSGSRLSTSQGSGRGPARFRTNLPGLELASQRLG